MKYRDGHRLVDATSQLREWSQDVFEPHLSKKGAGKRQREVLARVEKAPETLGASHAPTLEAVVDITRPVLFVRDNDFQPPASEKWKERLERHRQDIGRVLPSVGRVELRFASGGEAHIGTGFMVAPRLLLTNRHVASAFCDGAGNLIPGSLPRVDFAEEFERDPDQEHRILRGVKIGRTLDFALLEIAPGPGLALPPPLEWAREMPQLREGEKGTLVFAAGYPAFDPSLSPELQASLFRGIFGVKRLSAGRLRRIRRGFSTDTAASEVELLSDYTTLGGNSGSPVCALASGTALGLHYAGTYGVSNHAVPLWALTGHIDAAAEAVHQAPPTIHLAVREPESADPTLEDIEALQAALRNEPSETLAFFRGAWDSEISAADLEAAIAAMKTAAEIGGGVASEAALESVMAVQPEAAWPPSTWWKGKVKLPDDFTFDGMTDEIPIDPAEDRFETIRDADGWIRHTAQAWLGVQTGTVRRAPFRWANDYPSQFIYKLDESSSPRIGLFADFGTGLYHSRYIARRLAAYKPTLDCAIHLGDVYYRGSHEEFEERFDSILEPLTQRSSLFALNANHEMYTGGFAYFDSMDARRQSNGGASHPQEGSYFCLRSEHYQIIGIDTAYHRHGRHPEGKLNTWLRERLVEGRSSDRANILLSGDQPFDFGDGKRTDLFDDLSGMVEDRLIDYWFWGNQHYCALYRANEEFPFFGGCLGHGGYPYDRKSWDELSPELRNRTLFLEVEGRFPDDTGVRPDRGNNGFAVVQLEEDRLTIELWDWRGRLRQRHDQPRL